MTALAQHPTPPWKLDTMASPPSPSTRRRSSPTINPSLAGSAALFTPLDSARGLKRPATTLVGHFDSRHHDSRHYVDQSYDINFGTNFTPANLSTNVSTHPSSANSTQIFDTRGQTQLHQHQFPQPQFSARAGGRFNDRDLVNRYEYQKEDRFSHGFDAKRARISVANDYRVFSTTTPQLKKNFLKKIFG